MRLPNENIFEWTRITYNSTASSTNTVTVSNLTDYNEFLVVLTPAGSSGRFMNSMVVAKDEFLTNNDSTSGYHQLSDSDRSCGVSYMGSNQLKLYTGAYSGIAIYAR